MGGRYERELADLGDTYRWALHVDISALESFLRAACDAPLLSVGSGGSLTAATLAAQLHQSTGWMARATTPLGIVSTSVPLRDTHVLVLTAAGRNRDVVSAFTAAARREPRQLMALCLRERSPLQRAAASFRYAQVLGLELPSGDDGFLATNSLAAIATILIRAYGRLDGRQPDLPRSLPAATDLHESLLGTAQQLLDRDTWVALHGEWGLPAAADLESKCTEAALRHVQVADYRNFAHGRHHWLAKRGHETGVLALVSPEDAELADRTLGLLPDDIPVVRITSGRTGPTAALELLVTIFHVVRIAGTHLGVDPGRPGVPRFGRQLYHLLSLA